MHSLLARELNTITRYYDRVLQWLPREDDDGSLFSRIECRDKRIIAKDENLPLGAWARLDQRQGPSMHR